MTSPALEYTPRGNARELIFRCQAPEVLLSGPAGTGKSLACLWKLHKAASETPGLRALIARKTRVSLTQSILVTFERDVLPPRHPARRGPSRSHREAYHYPNGAEIAQGGLDQVTRIMSSEYDLVYVPEAIELKEEEWEALTTRLRNGRLPYQQLLADTNPAGPKHWLKRRCDAGKCLLLETRHEDNPRLWDGRDWTTEGVSYLSRLDALTGPRKQRLRHGRWVQAEGVVYETWDSAVHLIDRFAIPSDWLRLWSVDFGYTNPFVWQAWALDHDNRLFRYREIYQTRTLVEDHARRILELTRDEPPPFAVLCDHDAEDRATLERHLGLPTIPAVKAVQAGIQGVTARLRHQPNGRARLYLLRDSLDQRDADLDERKLPCCTEEEFDSYVWDTRASVGLREVPVKASDHGMDAMRYAVWSFDFEQAVDDDEPVRVIRT